MYKRGLSHDQDFTRYCVNTNRVKWASSRPNSNNSSCVLSYRKMNIVNISESEMI